MTEEKITFTINTDNIKHLYRSRSQTITIKVKHTNGATRGQYDRIINFTNHCDKTSFFHSITGQIFSM